MLNDPHLLLGCDGLSLAPNASASGELSMEKVAENCEKLDAITAISSVDRPTLQGAKGGHEHYYKSSCDM